MNEVQMARAETIVELSCSINDAIVEISKRHGNDPHLSAIVASALAMSINSIDKLSPGFNTFMVKMLEHENEV